MNGREPQDILRLLTDSRIISGSCLNPLTKETKELIAVITAIVINTKSGHAA